MNPNNTKLSGKTAKRNVAQRGATDIGLAHANRAKIVPTIKTFNGYTFEFRPMTEGAWLSLTAALVGGI